MQRSALAASGTRDPYRSYMVDMREGRIPTAHVPNWRRQIASAQPVTGINAALRSDELVGIDVRNPQDEVLGSVEDLAMSPQTGKIAYLVIGRGGIFGINEKYVPVPWGDFKVLAGINLLVLDATKAAMDAAPRVGHEQFSASGQFDKLEGGRLLEGAPHGRAQGLIRATPSPGSHNDRRPGSKPAKRLGTRAIHPGARRAS